MFTAGLLHRGTLAAAALATITLAASTASAEFVTPTGWDRGDAYSTYHEWDDFSWADAPNAPDVGALPATGPLSQATVLDVSGTAVLFDSGNLYGFGEPGQPLEIEVSVPGYNLGADYVTTLRLQIRTQGEELSIPSVGLIYDLGSGDQSAFPMSNVELSRIALGGRGGFLVEHAFFFNVPASAENVLLTFQAVDAHMSLDAVAVDAITTRGSSSAALLDGMNETIGYVPEPASLGVIALGAVTLLRRRRQAASA